MQQTILELEDKSSESVYYEIEVLDIDIKNICDEIRNYIKCNDYIKTTDELFLNFVNTIKNRKILLKYLNDKNYEYMLSDPYLLECLIRGQSSDFTADIYYLFMTQEGKPNKIKKYFIQYSPFSIKNKKMFDKDYSPIIR